MPEQLCRTVVERFPSRELAIRRLVLRNTEFSAVCDDHKACSEALWHWGYQGDKDRADEYRALLKEIEDEISAFLELGPSSTPQT